MLFGMIVVAAIVQRSCRVGDGQSYSSAIADLLVDGESGTVMMFGMVVIRREVLGDEPELMKEGSTVTSALRAAMSRVSLQRSSSHVQAPQMCNWSAMP